MNIKAIMDRVFFALSVPKCVCCRTPLSYGEKAFCPKCSAVFEDFKTRNCSRCAKILSKCKCSNDFLRAHYVGHVVKCYRYLNRDEALPGNSLIYSLKRDNRIDVLERCTEELASSILNSVANPERYVFTNVPRRKSAIIEHGIDHSALLAKAVADKLGAEYISILKSNAKKQQRSLETEDRFRNADFYISKEIDLTGKGTIIIDDIITSGATAKTASNLLYNGGVKKIKLIFLAKAGEITKERRKTYE
jgi:predicted amidophosphoribosyltransferase